jgi:hypothetical protein
MPTNLTRIGEVFQRTDTKAIWVVEGIWRRAGAISHIEVVTAEGSKIVRNEVLATELESWLLKGTLERANVLPGRKLKPSELIPIK